MIVDGKNLEILKEEMAKMKLKFSAQNPKNFLYETQTKRALSLDSKTKKKEVFRTEREKEKTSFRENLLRNCQEKKQLVRIGKGDTVEGREIKTKSYHFS